MALALDHLISCVPDLDAGAEQFTETYGLSSLAGGRHNGHGTANRIVPLGPAYIEIVAVVDPIEAEDSVFAAWVMANAVNPGLHAVCLRTDGIDELGRRLGLQPLPMTRLRPDGVTLNWRLAGLERMLADGLPFFIEWDVAESLFPGRGEVAPPNPAAGFDEVVLSGDLSLLGSWTEGCPALRIVDGDPGVVSATVGSISLG